MKYTFTLVLGTLFALLSFPKSQAQCPIPNACTPGNASNPQANLFGAGIFEVRLGSTFVQTSAGSSEGYIDRCSLGPITMTLGSPVSITVRTGNNFSENVRVFLDMNGDSVFANPGELVFSSNNAKVHSGNIFVPSGILGTQIKLRVTADLNTSPIPTPCSTPAFSQVEDYAVLLVANTTPPIARFFSPDTISCSGLVTFTDQSINNPSSWFWRFGDGQTSTSQNPTHQYASPGFYTVSLRVSSANGVDSLVKPAYIQVNDSVAAPAICQPQTINHCCGYGISRVRIHTLDNSSGLGSFQDFACTQKVTLIQGRQYPLQISTNPNQDQDTRVWIDYNRNGIFESWEMIFEKLTDRNPSGTVLISGDTAVRTGVPLRMRVISEYSGGIFGPCTQLDKGQAEDYTVYILPNNFPPVANFEVRGNSCSSSFTFQSTSENVIAFYHWYFGDGNDTLTLSPNVTHVYDSTGTYDVSLVVVGPNGSDSLFRAKAVTYFGRPLAACSLNSQVGGPQLGTGIRHVQFAGINRNSGNSSEGYQNFSCTDQAVVYLGQKITLTVRNSGTQLEKTRAWIDWNGNGQFETTEQVMNSQTDTVHTALVTIPATARQGSTLRMRVASNLQNAQNFGTCGTIQVGQAEDYGVVALPITEKPKAYFSTQNRTSCTGYVQFADSSENLPSSYLWDFGNSQTSTEANPLVQYTANGTYTIKLIVTNEFGSDTLVRTNYVTITGTTGMEPATCIPVAANTCCQYGIARVNFAGINQTSSPATEGYRDFTCGTLGSAPIGTQQTITVVNSGNNPETVAVWIDWNNDGTFLDAERAFTSLSAISHTGTITIPGNAPAGVGLRMRVRSDQANIPITTACTNPQLGQIEDYQLIITGNNQSPITLFSASETTLCSNTVSFRDTSFNAPSSWKWYFGDGDSATIRNPEHTYSGPGQYTVTLITGNATGFDTLVKINYITILPSQNLKPASCTPTTVNSANQPIGISNVTLGTINRESALTPTERYVDASCLNRTELVQGQAYPVSVTTNPNFPETVRIWIDWNNNGTFDDPQERVFSNANSVVHVGEILVPTTARRDTALRMRVMSDVGGGGGPINLLPCTNPNFGQIEDYAVVVRANTAPPQAGFAVASQQSCSGFVRFFDNSAFVPTAWLWNFGDGQTSTLQNPTHQYLTTGFFGVKLKVSNAFGSDSIEIPNYVEVSDLNGMPFPNCINTVTAPGQTSGTTRVRFGNLDKESGLSAEDGGYQDYTCSDSALVVITAANQTNPMIINTSAGNNRENCRVFIDFNNDGIFTIAESVLSSNNNVIHNASPAFNASQCLGIPVRMRVLTDIRFNQINGACFNPQQGQVEDYRVRLVWAVSNQAQLAAGQPEVYPNPGKGEFKVKLPVGAFIPEWSVSDVTGRILATGRVDSALSEFTLPLPGLPAGIYQLNWGGKTGFNPTRLIVQP